MSKNEFVLQMQNINKSFPGVKALNGACLDLRYGEVLALCGENGAGKSTLMKCLSGVYQPDPDSGEILYQGKPVRYTNPNDAKKDGIVLIFQELSLVMDLSVAENIYLGSLPMKHGRVDWKKLYSDAQAVLDKLGCPASPKDVISTLPIAQQQMVEIARGIALGAKVLILDEPTSSLTEREKNYLFEIIRTLKAEGVGIVYISHKMDEIFEISDRVLVFRDGQPTGQFVTKEIGLDDIVQAMIGRTLDGYFHKCQAEPGEEVLRVENLSLRGVYKDISFHVRRREVVGFYGLVGAGRSEIMETIFGVRRPDAGDIYMNGKKSSIRTSVDAVKNKIGFVTENRKEQGLVLDKSCRENIALAKLPWISKGGFVDDKATYDIYNEYHDKLRISSPSSEQQIVYLSGGNQQKVVIGKWLTTEPDLLILDEPTRGIDVGSKSEIHKLIADLAESGMAVIVISSEMPEIMGVSNRIYTIAQGLITGELTGDEITEENLIKAITITESAKHA
ncbi:sugar ABC transporter ATP-binding protein [Intestinibacillus sp. Marseille-P6563]|uniref:sugar ABC transporter ATP-binding protein n=1 Tax=Intestinibacillus sp. Marseille-P6563 TaxID=2364792 RepID=UPI000F04AD6B|nr:sugar ABC transporter ATP-binding protein [Intestinibacillus sp. Marseille-P6563]